MRTATEARQLNGGYQTNFGSFTKYQHRISALSFKINLGLIFLNIYELIYCLSNQVILYLTSNFKIWGKLQFIALDELQFEQQQKKQC